MPKTHHLFFYYLNTDFILLSTGQFGIYCYRLPESLSLRRPSETSRDAATLTTNRRILSAKGRHKDEFQNSFYPQEHVLFNYWRLVKAASHKSCCLGCLLWKMVSLNSYAFCELFSPVLIHRKEVIKFMPGGAGSHALPKLTTGSKNICLHPLASVFV